MGFYGRNILPRLIERGMRNKVVAVHRPRIPGLATGVVVEIGMGSGLNLPFYGSAVTRVFGLEPADHLREQASVAAGRAPFPVTLIGTGAEDIPLLSHSVDTVVTTWTLCSIPQVERALLEMKRVLKPGGRFLFMEHGRAPDPGVQRTQDRWTPVTRAVAGCNPGRPMEDLIRDAGFTFVELEKGYLDGPRFIAYHYIGQAVPA